MELPPSFADTRAALHAVAEHVLAAARYRAVGRIGLAVAPGGFGTPPFEGTVLRVELGDLVVERNHDVQRAPLTTLRAAAAFVGLEPGMPDTAYVPSTPLDLDRPLAIDLPSARMVAHWFAVGDDALQPFSEELTAASPNEDALPSAVTLWPEHFDLALSAAKVNYGVSPGDGTIGEPYAYVGPWDRPLPGDQRFWNQPFGATLTHDRANTASELQQFFRAGRQAASSA